ncbi:MAG TPA: hypothetical protein VF604_07205 [Pyrinomonadaceae bacterium]|jgi:hypothetical protein
MKPLKVFLALLFLFVSFQVCFGQEKSESVLVDEFGEIPCDDFLARLDNFFVALRNDPAATGYAVINGKKEAIRQSFRYRSWLRGWMKVRRFDSSLMTIIRGENSEKLKIQFRLIPAGASLPDTSDLGWNSLPITKPFNIYSEFDADEICPGDLIIRFSEILRENPDIRGHLVIRAKSPKDFGNRKKELLNEFREIAPSRLRFFHVRNNSDTYVEYWLVPRNQPRKRN